MEELLVFKEEQVEQGFLRELDLVWQSQVDELGWSTKAVLRILCDIQ